MRIISNKALRDFSKLHPQAATALQEWRKKIEATTSKSYAELKTVFNSVDKAAPCVRIVVASNFKKKIKFEIRNEKI